MSPLSSRPSAPRCMRPIQLQSWPPQLYWISWARTAIWPCWPKLRARRRTRRRTGQLTGTGGVANGYFHPAICRCAKPHCGAPPISNPRQSILDLWQRRVTAVTAALGRPLQDAANNGGPNSAVASGPAQHELRPPLCAGHSCWDAPSGGICRHRRQPGAHSPRPRWRPLRPSQFSPPP